MREVFRFMSVSLYLATGIICLIMALKGITARRFLPFHERAAGKSWDDIDRPLQMVILTIIRISGLGFFVVFMLLTIFPLVNYSRQDIYIKILIPVISLIFCFGLFIFNYLLYRETNAKTPWAGSLVAIFVISVSLIISII